MRVGIYRWATFAVVVSTFATVGMAQQLLPPPMVEPKVTNAPKAKPEASLSEQRAKLQVELLQLLKRIPATTPMPTPSVAPKPKPAEPGDGLKVNAIKEGMNLFRDNNFDAARRTFQLIDPTALDKEDRAFVRYMLACSLRRLGKTSDAEVIYREIANSPDDEFIANCAIWQLSLIRSEQELQAQLEQLRSRAKSK